MHSQSTEQLSVNPFLQRWAQLPAAERNHAFPTRNVRFHESFHAEERVRCDQDGRLLSLAFQQEGTAREGGGSHEWLPYQQQGTSHLHDVDIRISSISSSSSRRQANEHAATLSSMAHQTASSPIAGTSDALLPSSSGDDWCPGGREDEASGVTAQLPLGAMSPLHFGENETNSSTD